MKIKSIHIDGLHNALDKTYDFGDITYLFGHNGAGKSTVLQAIQLALLGYIPGTAKNKSEILRHSPKGDITIELKLDDVTITRRIWKMGNRIDVDPVTYDVPALVKELELPIFNFNEFVGQTANKLKDYFIKNILPTSNGELNWQKILAESILDCNFENKSAIVEYGMSIIDDLDGDALDQVVRANEKFKAEQSYNKSELQRLQNTIDSLIYYEDYTGSTDVTEINTKLLSANLIRDQLLKYNAADNAMKSAKEEIFTLQMQVSKMGDEEKYHQIDADLATIRLEQDRLISAIAAKRDEISVLNGADATAASVINSAGVCPYTKNSCKSILDKIDDLKAESEARKAKKIELQNEVTHLNDELNRLRSDIHNLETQLATFKTLWSRIDSLKKTLGDLPEKPDTDKTVEELATEIDYLTDCKVKLQANIKYNETIENITNLKFEAEMRSTALSLWVKKTDTNGLQTTLTEKPFEELADKMTGYIHQMYRNTDLKAHFDVSTKANSFSFGLVRDSVYIPYDLLSSGEKCLYALALMICITDNTKSPLKLLLCDDIFDHLDSVAIENTFKALKEIKDVQFIFAGVKDCDAASDVMLHIN